MSSIRLEGICKSFGTQVAVEDLTLEVKQNETVVLLGPSGCGKTTTLRLIAGLEHPDRGDIFFASPDSSGESSEGAADGSRSTQRSLLSVPAGERNTAMMFQEDALYPHLSCGDNISFCIGGRSSRWLFKAKDQNVQNNVQQLASRLGIEEFLDRKPHQLSGGQRQRVALARAMIRRPDVFLLDEPLSRLDFRLSTELQQDLKSALGEIGCPVLYVTHNQREAMVLADRVVVMDCGKAVQVGKPLEVYRRPANLFVASFMGEQPMNVLGKASADAKAEHVGFRAEDVRLAGDDESPGDVFAVTGHVETVQQLGDRSLVHVRTDQGEQVRTMQLGDANPDLGRRVCAWVAKDRLVLFDAAGQRIGS